MDSHDVIVRRAVLVAFCNGSRDMAHFIGEAVAYVDQPTYTIQSGDRHVSWVAGLCREATPDEAIAYWRERAIKAEAAA